MSVVVCRWMNDVTRTRSHRNGCPVEYTWFQWTGANLNIAAPCSRHTRSQIYFKSPISSPYLIYSPYLRRVLWRDNENPCWKPVSPPCSTQYPLFGLCLTPCYGLLVSRPGPPCITAWAPLVSWPGPPLYLSHSTLLSRWFSIRDFNLTCGVQKRREVGVRC